MVSVPDRRAVRQGYMSLIDDHSISRGPDHEGMTPDASDTTGRMPPPDRETWLSRARSDGLRPSEAYALGARMNALALDPAQAQAAALLDVLHDALGMRAQSQKTAGRALWRIARKVGRREPSPSCTGLYLVGAVGRGKSMVMDMFFALAPVQEKRRMHFHAFMQEARGALHRIQSLDRRLADPVVDLAARIARTTTLLCFDEFQITDMSDAVVILRLLNEIMACGTMIVATSNVAPDDLMRGQPGRQTMIPYIATFCSHMRVHVLAAARDYRRGRPMHEERWLVPDDMAATARLDAIMRTRGDGPPEQAHVSVGSRMVDVPRTSGTVARFSFADLCGRMLGAGDYLALTHAYRTILIDHVPRLDPERFDEARRFITLVDVLYERRIALFATAAAMPENLYPNGENAFAFERTVSRLEEMRSEGWLE